MIRFGSLHVIAFAYRVYYSQKNKACQAPKTDRSGAFSAPLLQKRGLGGLRYSAYLNVVSTTTFTPFTLTAFTSVSAVLIAF